MKTEKIKSVPLRMCVVCKKMLPKKELVRIIKTPQNDYVIDFDGKQNGRGAYLCNNKQCVDLCVKKRILNKVFGVQISDEVYDEIKQRYEQENI